MRPKDAPQSIRLMNGLKSFSSDHTILQGIQNDQRVNCFVEQIIESQRRVQYLKLLADRDNDASCSDPTNIAFDPYKAAIEKAKSGDFEESCWLTFLATHFGKTKTNKWMVVSKVYGGIDRARIWSWNEVTYSVSTFTKWFDNNIGRIKPISGSSFGNHRKFESLRTDAPRGTSKVIESYITNILHHGGHAKFLAAAQNQKNANPGTSFNYLYNNLKVLSFGRTAKFDLLTTLSKLQIMPIIPSHPYLNGATGPLKGSKLLLFNDSSVKHSTKQVSSKITALGDHLNLRMDVIEDALCNWQKSPSRFTPFRG